jgi:Tol biopolymer transport system component
VQRGRIVSARFSPDGSTVFYAAEWDGMPLEVFETRPGFPTSRGLGLAGAGLLSVSKGGTMEVVLDASWSRLTGTLAEVPLAGGAPRRITEDVSAAERLPDGRTLAVARRVAGRVRIEAPPGRVLHEGPGEVFTLRVSLDGARLAVVERPSPGDTRGSIVVMDTTGRVVTRTAEWNTIRGAAWSADGSEVWYCASNDLAFTDLRAVATDGSERVVARFPGMTCLFDVAESGRALLVRRCCSDGIRGRAPSGEDERELGWFDWPAAADVSADGASLLFDEQGVYGGPQYAVCLRGMDGSLPVRLGEGHALALSPDGAWALALRWGPPQALVLLPTGAGDEVSLPAGTIEQYYDARWMPDGRGIVFAAAERGRPPRTFVQDVAGGPPRPVTPEGLAGAVMSADGAFVLAASADRTLHACPMSGGEPRAVAALLPGETAVQVTPDARFAYTARLGPVAEVFHIELASGARTPWKAFGLSDTAGVSVWTMTLTRDGLGYAYTYCRTLDALYAVDGLR